MTLNVWAAIDANAHGGEKSPFSTVEFSAWIAQFQTIQDIVGLFSLYLGIEDQVDRESAERIGSVK